MQWYNKPAAIQETKNTVTITTMSKTDFWRTTRHDFIADNGHFYYQAVTGDFTAEVKFTGKYTAQYDQAGLMVRQDELVWLKCGVELLDGVQQAATVVTREFSDWSVIAMPDSPESLWLRVQRIGSAVEVYYSTDGTNYAMMRQTYLSEAETLQVGLLACSPTGDGFEVTFEDFEMKQ
jgi:regulation of enolase protein 1 (concanavalin A-like superfamily)